MTDADYENEMKRSGIYPYPDKEIVRCHRCGRTTARCSAADEYVFGVICGRADCQRVEEMLNPEFRCWEMRTHLPTESFAEGVPSCWSPDGEVMV